MGKWCLHASSFIFERIIIKVAGNQDRHKSSVEFDFGPNQTTHFGVTCPWVTKISHFWTWISLKPVGQSWSNFMCSIMGWGKGCIMFWGRLDQNSGFHGNRKPQLTYNGENDVSPVFDPILFPLHSGEQSLPFGLLVIWQDSTVHLQEFLARQCWNSTNLNLSMP